MKPPKDVEPSELFLKLSSSVRPSEVIDFPRRDIAGQAFDRIRMQVLSSIEHDEARFRALATLKAKEMKPEDMGTPLVRAIAGDATARELIAMSALTEQSYGGTPDKPIYGRIFRHAADVSVLSADEVLVLFNAYVLVQHKYGPFERNITSKEEQDAWVARLGEGASEFPLLELALPQLAGLTLSLAQRLYTLSRTLESQSASLPSTLVAQLESLLMDTSFAGWPAGSSTPTGSGPSTSVTLEAATELAQRHRDREG